MLRNHMIHTAQYNSAAMRLFHTTIIGCAMRSLYSLVPFYYCWELCGRDASLTGTFVMAWRIGVATFLMCIVWNCPWMLRRHASILERLDSLVARGRWKFTA